jgi:hypothetical protein
MDGFFMHTRDTSAPARQLQKLSDDDKQPILFTLNNLIKDAKLKA